METGEVLTRIDAEFEAPIPAVYKDEEYKVCVKPQGVDGAGNPTPPVFESRTRKVRVQSESLLYATKDKKGGLSIVREPALEVNVNGKKYVAVQQQAEDVLGDLKDDPAIGDFKFVEMRKHKLTDEFSLTNGVGKTLSFYVWGKDEKWYFVLADGKTVTKKLATTRSIVPGIYKDEEYHVMVKPETKTAGETSPAVFEVRTRKVCVVPESAIFENKLESISMVAEKVTIGKEAYSSIRIDPETKPVKPPKPKEEAF